MKKIVKGLLVTGGVAVAAVAGLYAWGKHVEKREKKMNSDEEFDLFEDEFEIKSDKNRDYVEINPSDETKENRQTVEIKTPSDADKDDFDEFS